MTTVTLFCHDLDKDRANKLAENLKSPIEFIHDDEDGTDLPAIELKTVQDLLSVCYAFRTNYGTAVNFDSTFVDIYFDNLNDEFINDAINWLTEE